MEAELESESKRVTELAQLHIRGTATYADAIRPRLRETSMRAASGKQLGLRKKKWLPRARYSKSSILSTVSTATCSKKLASETLIGVRVTR